MLTSSMNAVWPADTWRSCHVVVAVSGGADSVALLRGLVELHRQSEGPGRLIVAHYNHRLREEESDADQAWVARLAESLGLESVVGEAEVASQLVSEQKARNARYEFLHQAAVDRGARYVVTAHTTDDQVETVLMRVLRGSGIDGLTGIPVFRNLGPSVTLVRPMLRVGRCEVEAYLRDLRQEHRTDASNRQSRYTRNWVRNRLLPSLRENLPVDPDDSLLRLAQQASEWNSVIDRLTQPLLADAVTVAENEITVSIASIHQEPAIVAQQVVRLAWRSIGWAEQAMGMAEWQQIALAIADASCPPFTLPGGVRAVRLKDQLVLARDA